MNLYFKIFVFFTIFLKNYFLVLILILLSDFTKFLTESLFYFTVLFYIIIRLFLFFLEKVSLLRLRKVAFVDLINLGS
jgi:hypothetical protein